MENVCCADDDDRVEIDLVWRKDRRVEAVSIGAKGEEEVRGDSRVLLVPEW